MVEQKGKGGGGGGRRKGGRRRGEGGEEEGDDGGAGAEEDQEAVARLEAERAAILANGNMINEQKQLLLGELDRRQSALQQQRQAQQQLEAKIRAMESKLLSGQDFVSQTSEQQRELERKQQELAEQKVSSRC